ncbi:hypothetical protein HPP92_009379 [Vanilla planifolia]|uniref:Uncharacterized protein n=1 Tax=Vanilla planifolia TaxID=51239 RepID=A0A835V4N4_VANPL|nr:hypothetical protein HPP92_009379 [Vanilla planifolia]
MKKTNKILSMIRLGDYSASERLLADISLQLVEQIHGNGGNCGATKHFCGDEIHHRPAGEANGSKCPSCDAIPLPYGSVHNAHTAFCYNLSLSQPNARLEASRA